MNGSNWEWKMEDSQREEFPKKMASTIVFI